VTAGGDGAEIMSEPDAAKIALVLSGGGAHAAYGVGVMKALFEGASPTTGHTSLDPGIFTGASAGAINAAFMVSQPGIDDRAVVADLVHLWVDEIGGTRGRGNGVYRIRGDPLGYLRQQRFPPDPLEALREAADDALFFVREGFRRGSDFLASSDDLGRRVLKLFDLSQFISSGPIRDRMPTLMSLEGIRHSERVLRVVATNWTTGELHVFGNSDMTDDAGPVILSGASAIPGVFQPHSLGGEPYVDGSLLVDTPLMPAITAGADVLHVVYLDPDVRKIPLQRLQNTFDALDRVRVIDWAHRMHQDLATARWINEGLEVFDRLAAGERPSDNELERFVRAAAQIATRIRQGVRYRKLTIHLYRPHEDLGGSLGVMNFDRDQIIALIERGYRDVADHDCVASQCLLPG
jgi:predicted acylesterase/phospholipase RssA